VFEEIEERCTDKSFGKNNTFQAVIARITQHF